MNPDSLRLDDAELARLAAGGESARVEFKERLSGSATRQIEEAICAFANDLGGSGKPGIVIVGLRDDGTPAHTAITDELLLTLTNIRSNGDVLPPPMLLVERRHMIGVEVAVVAVAPSRLSSRALPWPHPCPQRPETRHRHGTGRACAE